MRKYSIFLIFALCLLFLGQASAWTSSEFTKDEIKSLDKLTNYGTYTIKESAWYDPLKIWKSETTKEYTLDYNDDNGCQNCIADLTINLKEKGTLIDELNFYTIDEDGKRIKQDVRWSKARIWDNPKQSTESYLENECTYTEEGNETCSLVSKERSYYYKMVDDYKWTCEKTGELSKNGTAILDCSNVKVGEKEYRYDGFRDYTLGSEEPADTYKLRILANKPFDRKVDWVLTTSGQVFDRWAIWGVSDMTNGLVAQYRANTQNFTLNNQTQVLDFTGVNNGTLVGKTFNDGTVYGGITIEDGAMKFDGVDGRVATTLTDNSIFNGTNGFTIISWINPINGGAIDEGRIIDKTSGITSAEGFFFRITYASNNARLITRINGGTTVASSSNAFLLNSWSLVTATILQNGTVSYTVNGVSVGGGTLNNTTQITTSQPLTIGNRAGATDRSFNGSIDDTLIFNRALSQDEITQLYNQGRGSYSSVTNGLVAQYSGRDFAGTEASPTTIYDTNHLGDGKVLESLSFDGSKYVESSANINNTLFNQSGTYAVSNWFKLSEIPSGSDKSIWNFQDGGSNRISLMVRGSSIVGFQRYNGSAYTNIRIADTTLETNRWYHVVAISENGNLDLYFDGEIANVRTDNLYAPLGNSNKFRLGFASTTNGAYSIHGSIDDVRIYNRTLSEDEIAYLYNSGLGREDSSDAWIEVNSPANNSIQYTNSVTVNASAYVESGAYLTNASLNLSVNGGAWEIRNTTNLEIGGDGLVSYYTLDETTGTTAFDSMGLNNATNNGATINQIGKIDKAYSFDGVNDYVVGTGIDDSLNGVTSFSINVWVKPTNLDGNQMIISDVNYGNGQGYVTYFSGNNFYTGYSTYPGISICDTGGNKESANGMTFNNNNWYLISQVINTTGIYTWINGEFKEKLNCVSTGTYQGANAEFRFGDYKRDGGSPPGVEEQFFTGYLDEIGIWNRSLSSSEITALYNSGAGLRPTTTTTTTTTFTNTFNAGDVVDFNYEFCDTDGDCGQSETRRFTIDGTAPTINASLNETILYVEGDVVQLNTTITDINIDKVWYSYNGTNTTIDDVVSGEANLTNIVTTLGALEIIVYANDTAGNLATPVTLTLTLDPTEPTINLSYPTALIDYGRLNGTLQLNFTATDTNLDKVWYIYGQLGHDTFESSNDGWTGGERSEVWSSQGNWSYKIIGGTFDIPIKYYSKSVNFDDIQGLYYDIKTTDTTSGYWTRISIGGDLIKEYNSSDTFLNEYINTSNITGVKDITFSLRGSSVGQSISYIDNIIYLGEGERVDIAGAVSGVYNQSNITLTTKKNVTIYANDTAGNLKAEVFGWDYKVFENSRSFVNETYAKVSNPFIVNITSTNISSVILNYNGANYTTNLIPSGLNRISSVNVLSPLVSNDTNITFYWLFILTDGSVIQSPSNIQTIRYLVIGNTYSNLIYNITIRNENNNSIIANTNVTMTYEVEYGFDINSILGTANFNDNKLANKNISSNIFSSLYLNGDIVYSADNFIGRNYYFLENNISSPKNVTLYLASDTDAFVKSISVVDEAGRGKPALYKQYRNIGGVNVLVASEQLDVTGKSTISFIPNVQYIFEFETADCVNLSKNIIFFDQSEYQQVLSCSGYDPDDYINEFEGMLVSFSPNGIFYVDNDTEADNSVFYGNVSGTSSFCSSIDTISFSVYNSNGNLISNTNANSCTSLSVTGYFSNYAVGKMYVLLNSGEEKTISFRWIKTLTQKDYSDYNVLNLMKEVGNSEDILGIDWKMKLLFSFIGLFAIIITLATFGRRYNLSNFVMLVIVDIYIWFMSFIGWANLNFGSSEGGFSTLISQYAIFFFAILGTIGIIATKEDEYS